MGFDRKAYMKKYGKNYIKVWSPNHPWYVHYNGAQQRCENNKLIMYHRYGGRGIKLLMTPNDFKKMWLRDKAFNMKRPSIDRIDNDGNYEYSNCRFIEVAENVRRSKLGTTHKGVKINQYDRHGNFITSWDKISDACKILHILNSSISNCLTGMSKIAGGYKWEYA